MNDAIQTHPAAAAALVTAAMALLGLTDNLVILVAGDTGVWQFHLLRSVVALGMIALAARIKGLRLRPIRPTAVAWRSLCVAGAMFCYFGALAFLPVAQTAAGLFTAPIWVLLISIVGVGARVNFKNVFAILAGFGGVMLVLQPDFGSLSPALIMPIASGVLYALGAIATRRTCAQEGTLTLLAGFFLAMAMIGTLGCITLALAQPLVPVGSDGFLLRGWMGLSVVTFGMIALMAAGAVLGVGMITKGYLLAEAAFVSVFEYTLLIFGAFWGWVLWEQGLNGIGVAGIVLIMISGALLTRASRRRVPLPKVRAVP